MPGAQHETSARQWIGLRRALDAFPHGRESGGDCTRRLVHHRIDILQVVEVLNPVLRGWGNYFRTGNASLKFQQVDRYVNRRLVRLLRHVRGWRRRPFVLRDWGPERFVSEFGLYRLVGTIRYPGFVNAS
jgi:hypothetical protein